MNERPAADWATAVATECLVGVHTLTAGQATTLIAVALRDARAKGYAECLTAATPKPPTLFQRALAMTADARAAHTAEMRAYAATLGRSHVRSPAELRQHRNPNVQQHRVGD